MAQVQSEVRTKALEALKGMTSKMSESKMNFYNRDLSSRLNSIDLEVHEEIKQNQETINYQLDSTIENAAEEYKRSMVECLLALKEAAEKQNKFVLSSVLGYFSRTSNKSNEGFTAAQMPAISPKYLQTFHTEFEANALALLSKFVQNNGKKFKDPTQTEQESREKLTALITQSFSHFQLLAEQKAEDVKAQTRKDLVKAEQDFENELKILLNNAKDAKYFKVEASLLKSQARTRFENSMQPSVIGEQSAQEIMSDWDSKVERLLTSQQLSHYKILAKKQHEQRIENAKAAAISNVTKFEQEFRAGMKKLVDNTREGSTFELEASDLKSRLRTQLENSMDESLVGKETIREHLSQWDSKVEKLLKQYKGLFALKKKEDEIELKSASAKAQQFFSDQMRTIFDTKAWYPSAEFRKINDKVLEDTLSRLQNEDKISTRNITLLRKSLQGLHQKFQEENELRVPKGSHAIGIDLGTTYSCVGVYVNGKVEIIQENEKFTIPSCVYFDEGNNRAVGEAAQDGALRSPENFIFDAKRLIGRTWNEPVVQGDMKQWNFNVIEVVGQPRIKCRAGILRPEEISAQVLVHLKSLAEKHLGQKVTNAVVTVPAYFNDSQRQATKDAAEIAGLTATILKEPVAAAMAYRLERTGDSFGKKNVLVFDFGGGTFDIAIVTISNWNLHVKTISGDMHLGGEDFDNLMVKHVMEKFKAKTGRDLVRDKASSNPDIRMKANNFIRRLKMECERKKRALSTAKLVRIVVEQADWTVDEKMTQQEFEQLVNPSLVKCMDIVEKALKEANMSKNDIHDIVLVGGSTKIPKVQELLKVYFKGVQLRHSVNPDQAVAYGAAIQAAIKVGSGTQGQSMRNKLSVNDVTPFSIGIKDKEGKLVVQVPKGSNIPFSHKNSWFTVSDYQTGANFTIFEGEDPVAENNRQLGKFILNVPSMKAGEAKMESTTLVDDEGIVRVKAVCLIDGAENDIVIDTFNGRMTRSEIENSRKATEERRG